jgi:hypothetical protein
MSPVALSSRPLVLRHTGMACPGCRVVLPDFKGPTHAYMGASPACWALYRRLSTPPFARRRGTRLRRLVEDAYAVQHPGGHERRELQSVAVHLMGLCVLLERGDEPRKLVPALGRMPARKTLDLHWLDPPARNGKITAAVVVAAGYDAEFGPSVEAWARDVWAAWAPHHPTVRAWLDTPCLQIA